MVMMVIIVMVLLSEKVQQSLIALSLDHQYPILEQLCLPPCHHHDRDDGDDDGMDDGHVGNDDANDDEDEGGDHQ